jgi:glycerophosphoryl diester phosphodiesterase
MKLIAHRGNIDGPDPSKENNPEYIEQAIAQGFDVEIDLRYSSIDNKFYLGHDNLQYEINLSWLSLHIDYLWIHCKDIESLYYFANNNNSYNYFWHQEDDFTLTSKGYIWTYPGKSYTTKSIIVMPEWENSDWDKIKIVECYGICSDYVSKLL